LLLSHPRREKVNVAQDWHVADDAAAQIVPPRGAAAGAGAV
jgi:hypothetical protein